jgi:hypothetical protein
MEQLDAGNARLSMLESLIDPRIEALIGPVDKEQIL